MSKVLYLSLMGSLLLGASTSAIAGSDTMEATIRKLEAQVNALTTRLNSIDTKKQRANSASHSHSHLNHHSRAHKEYKKQLIQETAHQAEDYVNKKLDEKEKQTPVGYIDVAGSNTAIKIGGYAKLDAIYDANAFTGDTSALPDLALRYYTPDALRTGSFRMHGRESRIALTALTTTKDWGDLTVFFDGDFLGTTNFGTTQINRSEAASSSAYNFRLRRFYADFAGFLVGQDWSNLHDLGAMGSSVELNGPTGRANIRTAQIRYTMKNAANTLVASVALENPYTDYTDHTGTRKGGSSFLGGSGGDGYPQLPDLTMKLRASNDVGHIALRGMARQLTVKAFTTNNKVIRKSRGGWALGFSGKVKTIGKGGIFGQALFGDGIGRYIFDLPGQGAAFDPLTQKFTTQRAWGITVGVEHYWTEQWRSNLIYGHTGVSLAKFAPRVVTATIAPISRSFDQVTINTFYSPVKNIDVGLEFDYYLRKTTGGYKGVGKRFQLGVKCALN